MSDPANKVQGWVKVEGVRGLTEYEADFLRAAQNPEEFFTARLEAYRVAYAAGDNGKLPLAIKNCGEMGVPLPRWIVDAWADAYNKVISVEATWDDLLLTDDYPRTPRAMEKARIEVKLMMAMVWILSQHRQHAIDETLFETLGRKLGITCRQARELYYKMPAKLRLEPKKKRAPPPKKATSKKL